jgi:hypothetical protein
MNTTNRNAANAARRRRRKTPMTRTDFFRLCTWLQSHAADVTEHRPPLDATASDAAAAIHVRVTPRDVVEAMRATKVLWQPRRPTPPDATTSSGVRRLRDRRVDAVIAAVRALFAKLGEPLPVGFDEETAPAHAAPPGRAMAMRPGRAA